MMCSTSRRHYHQVSAHLLCTSGHPVARSSAMLRPTRSGVAGRRMSLLEVHGLTVTYGGSVLALDDVSLAIEDGGTMALLGANGAGKTTLLRAVTGLLAFHGGRVRAGGIRFDGRSILGLDPAGLVEAGIGQALEGRRIFTELTVRENLRVGAFPRRARAAEEEAREGVLRLFPRLRDRIDRNAGVLSGGEQQMLAVARALMARPRLLLLDEPSLGLAPRVVHELAVALRQVSAAGTAILLVDQSTILALEVASCACLLETGRVRTAGATAELLDSDQVRACYLGTTAGHDVVSREAAHSVAGSAG
jgi:branched-chain amino acid transport system ATP-binding protein